MNIGMTNQQGGMGRWMSAASQPRTDTGPMSRGERIVGRLDQNGDGKLALNELAESKIGQKLTVARMAKMDANGDGMLEASEFGSRRSGEAADATTAPISDTDAAVPAAVPSETENAVIAQMADYYTAPVRVLDPEVDAKAEALAKEIIKRLDADGSGKLNSEEIAGTRLAEKIGEGFYNLDADKSGGLDIDELFGFLYDEIMTLAEERGLMPGEAEAPEADALAGAAGAEAAETVAASGDEAVVELVEEAASAVVVDEADAAEDTDVAEAVEESTATATTAPSDFELSAEDLIKTAFENALKMIQEGQENRSTYDVVSALYGNVKGIFDAA